MSRTEDFGRLREEIQAGRRDRRELVADLSMEFVANLRRTVAGLRKRFMDENRAAHAAWFGPTRAEKAAAALLKEAANAAPVKVVANAAPVKVVAKAVPVKVTKKPSKKGRGR